MEIATSFRWPIPHSVLRRRGVSFRNALHATANVKPQEELKHSLHSRSFARLPRSIHGTVCGDLDGCASVREGNGLRRRIRVSKHHPYQNGVGASQPQNIYLSTIATACVNTVGSVAAARLLGAQSSHGCSAEAAARNRCCIKKGQGRNQYI